MQQVDDPPYLSVGTEVSAKYKGAFCEAKVRKVVRNIKCKVAYKQGLGSGTVSDDQIKGGNLRVGATVEVKHPDRREFVEATITKIQDCSQYTVVFDDGDITTLRRSALCLKSGRHFNESETLDQLPLTHPEHFGNPVVGGRRGRRSRAMHDDSSDEEDEVESTKPAPHEKEEHIGKVVCVESTETKKKNQKENWFPGLVVAPTAQDTVRIRVKDEYLVRSFKDGRYYTVPKKEATQFTREQAKNQDGVAVQAALEYLDNDTLPPHWDRDALFGISASSSDYDQEFDSDSSDDEPREEKDHFVAQLYKYMDDRGTPLNKGPSIVNRDIDLYRLFRAAQKLGGYNRVTSQNQWKAIALRLGFVPATTSITNLVKQAYKKFLQPFEEFNRKLGCTMVAHPRANRIKGRSLVRANSVASPKPVDGKETKSVSSTATDEFENSESSSEPTKTKRKLSTNSGNGSGTARSKVAVVEKVEEKIPKEEEVEPPPKPPPKGKAAKVERDVKEEVTLVKTTKAAVAKEEPVKSEVIATTPTSSAKKEKATPKAKNDDKRGRKKKDAEATDKADVKEVKGEAKKVSETTTADDFPVEVGDKLNVYYHEETVTYEAKVIEKSTQNGNPIFLVHYTGWNTRYDEWVPKDRIVENLTNKQKRTKSATTKSTPTVDKPPSMPPVKSAAKRGRGGSRSDSQPPRSTTPSSITSNSSRTKSPATPAQRRTTRGQPQNIRRTSNNTDISSLHTESDTDSDEPVKKPSRATTSFTIPGKAGPGTVPQLPEAIVPVVAMRNVGKEIQAALKEDEEATKGRDYDLNQIRSELKGFKEMKSPSPEAAEQSPTSSSHHDHKTSLFDLSDSNTDSSEQKSDVAKGKLTSGTSSECDSFGDDDSQSSEKLVKLEKAQPVKAERVTKKSLSEKKKEADLLSDKNVTKVAVSVEKMETKALTGKMQGFKGSLAEKKKEEKAAKAETPTKKTTAKGEKTPTPRAEKKAVGEKTKAQTTPKTTKTPAQDKKEPPTKEAPAEGDIYEFKEPEPFEFESATGGGARKMATPATAAAETTPPAPPEKKGKKARQPPEDTEAKPAGPAAKKAKKTPTKAVEVEKVKPLKKDENLDALIPVHLIPIPNVKQTTSQPPVTTVQGLSSDPFDALRKSPSFNLANTLSSSSPEMPTMSSAQEQSTSKLPIFTDDKFLKISADVKRPVESFKSPAFVNSFTNVLDAPCQFGGSIKDVFKGTEDDKMKIDATKDLETAKKMFLASESPFDIEKPLKIEGPSIADKILMKSLSTQPSAGGEVKTEESQLSPAPATIKSPDPTQNAAKVEVPTPPVPPPVKFEIPPMVVKKEVEVKVKTQAVLPCADAGKADPDMPPKNNDLCETIQKLESAIQKSSTLNRFTEDSSDSTDSEQRLVIEDESHSSEAVQSKEVEKKEAPQPAKPEKSLTVPPLKVDSITLKEESLSFATKFQESLYGIKSPENPASATKIPQTQSEKDPLAVMKSPSSEDTKPDLTCKESFDDFFTEKKEAVPEGGQISESFSLLLCEETIPCSPVASGHLREAGESAKRLHNPHPITADIKPVPMDIETTEVKVEPQRTPNSSPRDSISPDDRTEESGVQKKRKRLRKSSESEVTTLPKRRKPPTRRTATSATNGSDSEDNSDPSSTHRTHVRRSPKPCQYNFLVQLDPALNSGQRIAILKKKIQELRKTYNQIKAELASIDRRRKKLRRRERENKKNQQKAAAT
ncbi:AT-rich interactive domain-containing protein 4B isoform X2 [Phlebotomus argentipes]|uniref:AT-rich interactive domain-containing protein 4B isoform X2 n=1 Tax=Phlebotomus argentipes TaxID=94469 RepID=UPI002892A3F3|nr:AT-rich interactive domain-containing protein 4B isoform X2 [Phlebotomus argentipes]